MVGRASRRPVSETDLEKVAQQALRTAVRMLGQGHEAEDAAQDALVRLLTSLGRLDGSRLIRYAAVVTRNLIASQQRSRSPCDSVVASEMAPWSTPEESALLAEEHRAVRR